MSTYANYQRSLMRQELQNRQAEDAKQVAALNATVSWFAKGERSSTVTPAKSTKELDELNERLLLIRRERIRDLYRKDFNSWQVELQSRGLAIMK